MLSLILLILIAVFAVWGLIAGIIKGFTNSKSSAVELVLVGVICIIIGRLLIKSMASDPSGSKDQNLVPAIITLAAVILLICVFMSLFAFFRKSIRKKIEKRKLLSYYRQYDEQQANTEEILDALSIDDTKTYKKLSKRKFKQSAGGWGVANRILGGVVLAIRGVVLAGFISVILIMVLEFSRLSGGSMSSFCGNLYESKIWLGLKSYIFDFIFVGIIMMCIKSGYENGITNTLWSLIMIVLVIGSIILSYKLAFTVEEFGTAAQSIGDKLAESMESIGSMLETVGLGGQKIGKVILMILVFIPLLFIVILIGKFVPRILDSAREGKIFHAVDGAFGAIITTALVLVILLVIGSIFKSISDLEFMQVFTAYFEKSGIATFIYTRNIFIEISIKSWFEVVPAE